jgi:hypothetical protein
LAAWANSSGILIVLFSGVSAAFALLSPNAITVPAPAIALVMNFLLETSGPFFLALFLLSVLSMASPVVARRLWTDDWVYTLSSRNTAPQRRWNITV